MLVAFAVFGVGTSMVNAPVTTAAVSGMPTDRAGAAAAITSTSRQVGVAIGVAICGPVAGAALGDTNVDFAVSAQPLWLVFAGVGVLIFTLGVYSTSKRAALSRASGAADRRNRSATGGCRCRVIRKRTRSGAR